MYCSRFRNYVLQNFPYIEDDFDALTDYELFCKIAGYVLKYSKDNEEMKKKIAEFQTYFDNLDVQEEIDNKLDEMVEDGTLAEIINQEIFSDINDKIDFNRSHELADCVQSFPADIDLSTTFPSTGWSISGFVLTPVNSVMTGVVVANDWSAESQGRKFTIKTFDYTNNVISNVTIAQALVTGHSNGICKIDNTHVLIIGMSNNYVFDIEHNDLTEITSLIPYCRSCAEYNGHIYVATDFDHDTNQVVNAMYEIEFDSLYHPTVVATHTLEGYYDKVKMQNQGMVIYQDLIIFPTFNSSKLVIWDYNTLQYLKTQVFTAPYMVEYENGFVYEGKLLLNDGYGKVFIPDLYCHETYGDYTHNTVAKSVTDICVYDDLIKLDGSSNPSITFNFGKYICFSHNPYSDIGTIGGEFESFTIYGAVRNYRGSTVLHNITPIEVPLYKGISYESESNSYEMQWETSYMNWRSSNNKFERNTICGSFSLGGGDSVPTMTITMSPYILTESFNTDGTQSIEIVTGETYAPQFYITKIIGHRKVGLHY